MSYYTVDEDVVLIQVAHINPRDDRLSCILVGGTSTIIEFARLIATALHF